MTEKPKAETKLPLSKEQVAHEFTLLSYLIKQGMSIKYNEEILRYVAIPEPDILTIFYDVKNPKSLEFSAIKNGVRVRIFCEFDNQSQRFKPVKMQIIPLRAFE